MTNEQDIEEMTREQLLGQIMRLRKALDLYEREREIRENRQDNQLGGIVMTDYNVTRNAAGKITDRFSTMLKNLQDEYEEEIVVVSLMEYYDMCSKPDKIDNTVDEWIDPDEDLLWAIERVLQDYMTSKDFNDWVLTRGYPKR